VERSVANAKAGVQDSAGVFVTVLISVGSSSLYLKVYANFELILKAALNKPYNSTDKRGMMKVKYNAPVTLTFALLCTAVLAVDQYVIPDTIALLFTAEGKDTFDINVVPSYVRMFTHVYGHFSWDHLLSNMTFILLLGPILEEKHGSWTLALMIFLTAMINGLINAFFFPTELIGASGIVFMMILLISFANIKRGEIPLTFMVIVAIYLAREFSTAFKNDDISQISHIVGGCCGSIFGFIKTVASPMKKKGNQDLPPVS